MKKTILILSLTILGTIFYSCKKDDTLKTQISKSNTVVGSGKHLKDVSEPISADEIVYAVQSFQNNRIDFRESNSSPDYTLSEALFRMPLVINFELGGYGYFSDLEVSEMEIDVANNGTTEDGEIVLDGNDMFDKYSDVEYYVNNQLGELKLFNADFIVKEKNEEHTVFTVKITAGVLNENAFGHEVSNEFPVIPINTNPNCSAAGTPQYVADAFTSAYNSAPVNQWYCRAINQILVNYGAANIYPDPAFSSTWFIYHDSYPQNIAAYVYNNDYYNWINSKRLDKIQNNIFAYKIKIYFENKWPDMPSPPQNWVQFMVNHSLYVYFAKYESVPELFNANGPIIP